MGADPVPVEPLGFLADWYAAQCDGDWEHAYGIRITTLDNPGWAVDIDIEGTGLEGAELERRETDADADHWLQTWSDGHIFHARCGPTALATALGRFQEFADQKSDE
jgi:hypothetical protein